ncbi:ATP-dependent Clp protease adapter protein ClpS [Streptomyces sp. enrichment culture]
MAGMLPPFRQFDDLGSGGRNSGPVCATTPLRWQHGHVTSPAPLEIERTESAEEVFAVPEPDVPWVTIVHNDPVNLMSYVTYVFQSYFGYSKDKATKLMMDVHHKGRAVVSSGTREEMERDVQAMHGYGLWATLQHDRK